MQNERKSLWSIQLNGACKPVLDLPTPRPRGWKAELIR